MVRDSVLRRAGYLAGDDDRRADELAQALVAPGIRGVIAARGGYGAMRILDRVPWSTFVEAPRWLVGFSDITALHLTANTAGVPTVHAPHVTGLGRATPRTRLAFLRVLEGTAAPLSWSGLRVVHAGEAARGPLVGGNLALVEAMAAAGRLVVPQGAVLVLEDVTERPYRIDRMLTSLLLGGHLARASAVVFGTFTQCDPGPDRVTVDEVIAERTRRLRVPVLSGAPFGHGDDNDPFVLGADVEVHAHAGQGRVAAVR